MAKMISVAFSARRALSSGSRPDARASITSAMARAKKPGPCKVSSPVSMISHSLRPARRTRKVGTVRDAHLDHALRPDETIVYADQPGDGAGGNQAKDAAAVAPAAHRVVLHVGAEDALLGTVVDLSYYPLCRLIAGVEAAHVEIVRPPIVDVVARHLDAHQVADGAALKQVARSTERSAEAPLVVEGQLHAPPLAFLRHQARRPPRIGRRLLAVD